MSRKQNTEINAGSMADIAFLLLIFFLVTTTLNVDSGILRKIPPKDNVASEMVIRDRNFLEVQINSNNEVMVDNKLVNINDLKQIGIDFIDNGGGLSTNNLACDWCKGEKQSNLSDHPTKAFINIKSDRNSTYETYIAVLDQFNASYNFLRNRVAVEMYQKNYETLLDEYQKSNSKNKDLENKILKIRDKYPLLLSDADIHN